MKRRFYNISLIFLISLLIGVTRSLILKDINIIKSSPKVLERLSNELFNVPNFIDLDLCKNLFDEGALFIDARDSSLFSSGHISGSINIPWDISSEEEISNSLKNILYDRIIIVYCGGGDCTLSMDLADHIFNNLGFEKVLIFEGGYPIWIESKFPIEGHSL